MKTIPAEQTETKNSKNELIKSDAYNILIIYPETVEFINRIEDIIKIEYSNLNLERIRLKYLWMTLY